jgi:hypothetical protein
MSDIEETEIEHKCDPHLLELLERYKEVSHIPTAQ